LRISSIDDDLLVEASRLLGVSVSEFLLSRAVADAEKIVEAHQSDVLQADSYQKFLEVLDTPPHTVEKLIDQARRARSLQHVE
jgi:uncharacterized protein (DUF1778 family)